MSSAEGSPSRLSEREVFVVFDVISKRGKQEEAQEKMRGLGFLRHRETIARVFRVGVELFNRKPNAVVLTTKEADEIAGRVGYGVSVSRVVELQRLYEVWKNRRREETEKLNVDAILSTLGPERWRQTWFLHMLKGLDEKTIADKLKTTVESVRYDIEIGERELEKSKSKTKAESKMEQYQSMLNLPSWVNLEQQEHLEGSEQRDDLEGIDVITYPRGAGIRQQLGFFQGSLSDIDPQYGSFWHPLDKDVMTQLRGHLPDETFWSQVEKFREKDERCGPLLDAAYKRFTSAGKELAPLQPPGGPVPDAYITSGWARQVLVRALSRELGLKEPGKYHHQNLPDGRFALEDDGRLIYTGSDDVMPEQKHRELVNDFNNSDQFNQIAALMKQLQNLRQQILARINQCLRKREYSFNYCSDCPAEQARKILASKGNN